MDFSGKTILIGISGGVAAYKAYDLIRELYRRGCARVLVALSPSAEKFISPLTLQSLSKQAVISNHLAVDPDGVPYHIAFAQQADAFLLMPATANTLGKVAHGLSDDMLSTTAICWTEKPLLIAPAMNTRMWNNPMVQQNITTLKQHEHITFIEPNEGLLACGETGQGHLAHQEMILHALYKATHPQKNTYTDIKAVVTLGGTEAPIDAVRMITNRSSGKMGLAFAQELSAMGADVTAIITQTVSPERYKHVPFTVVQADTVDALNQQMNRHLPNANLLVMTAAVSDFEPEQADDAVASTKIKRGDGELTLTLKPTTDLLKAAAERYPHCYTLGFAAESSLDIPKAQAKRTRKNIDALCLNDISRSDIGFGSEQNEVTLITHSGETHFGKAPKWHIARSTLTHLVHEIPQTTQKPAANTGLKV